MKKNIFKYLSTHFSKKPKDVDRLLISAFLKKNNIAVRNNILLILYTIKDSDKTGSKKLNEVLREADINGVSWNFETLIELFEFVISPEDRIVSGAVYTPSNIREYLIAHTFSNRIQNIETATIADISCGCGGFLYSAAREIKLRTNKSYADIFSNQIFGLDIQDYSIRRTELLLTLLAIYDGEDKDKFHFNLFKGDALEFEWSSVITNFSGFQAIVGNPPYVCSRNINLETKRHLSKWKVCSTGHPDLYIPFFQIGIENLAPNGMLGYITMNTFFKSVNGRALRKYFHEKKLLFKLIDFGITQIFRSRSTYTCLCLIENRKGNIQFLKCDSPERLPKVEQDFITIPYDKLDNLKGWNLQNNSVITKIELVGRPFGEKFVTRNGIATLKNNIYIFSPVMEDDKYYYLENGSTYPIEKDICKNIINPNMLTEVESLRGLKEKIIFPYAVKQDKVLIIGEPEFKRKFPKSYLYLESKKSELAKRDKGKGKNYKVWYSFGRNQSLEKLKYKLFFPHITPKTPNFIINNDEELLFYNGIAVIGKTLDELMVLKKVMQSKLFWFYIENSSKPYGSGYYSLSKNYIKNFGICDFTKEEKEYVLNEKDRERLDAFFEAKYGVNIDL